MTKTKKDLRLLAILWFVIIPILAITTMAVANYVINSTVKTMKVVPYGLGESK